MITGVGLDGSLHFYWQAIGTAAWNPQEVAGPGTTLSASVASQSLAHAIAVTWSGHPQ